jgi:hypothetical protein
MKKLIFTLGLVLLSFYSFSQNALGYSYSDIKKLMINEGHIIDEGFTSKDNTKYINGYGSNTIRLYFFTENNICFFYVFCVKGANFSNYEKSLLDDGFKRLNDKYYKGQYIANIFYNEELEAWCTSFIFK